MKRPTYWTSMVINPKRSPADIAIRALLHSGEGQNICTQMAQTSFLPTWQDLLFGTDEVDNDGAKYEAVEEHDGLEASVAEEGTDDAEDEIEGAYRGSVRVVGPNDFEVVLQFLRKS